MDVSVLITIISVALIVAGLIAIIIPFTPSIPTIWFGIFLYMMIEGLSSLDQSFFLIISLTAAATIVFDYTLGRSGMAKLQAGPWGVVGAVVGGIIGSFFGTVAAYLIGPLVGALVFELFRGRDQVFSFKTGNTRVVGSVGSTLIKMLAAIFMISMFVLRLQGKI